ncbi:hypothetical protein LPL9_2563 [Lacticaseibacillus paracasei]|nr:hypothetical protein LPL9_2563 [Lacticaseibacillus paracasei]QHV90964.1 hypothetical protein EOK76_g0492 [Lacticaseibacillus paracasei]
MRLCGTIRGNHNDVLPYLIDSSKSTKAFVLHALMLFSLA